MNTQSSAAHQPDRAKTTLLIFEHDEFSAVGGLHDWARERDLDVVGTRPDQGATPDPTEFGGLVVFGSVDSAHDASIQSWFGPEVSAIQSAVRAGIPVLGICFGAQALSVALGGRAYRAPESEIGWIRIRTRDPDLIDAGPWMQWHHDTFSLPPGASVVAESDAGIQAFTHGIHLGVQFHPEVTLDVLRIWAEEGRVELEQYGIEPDTLLAESARLVPRQQEHAYRLFDHFLTRVAVASA